MVSSSCGRSCGSEGPPAHVQRASARPRSPYGTTLSVGEVTAAGQVEPVLPEPHQRRPEREDRADGQQTGTSATGQAPAAVRPHDCPRLVTRFTATAITTVPNR